MGSIILQLVHITQLNIRTQLTTTLWCKRLNAINHTLLKKRLKGGYREAIPESYWLTKKYHIQIHHQISKIKSYVTVT